MSENKPYLKQDRLADVLALIQVLSFDKYAHRSVEGLNIELQGKPKSADSWKDIVFEHPEFFRMRNRRDETENSDNYEVSLILRHVLTDANGSAKPLEPDIAKKFFETAVELYKIQSERSKRWIAWFPIVVALISLLGSIFVQYQNNSNQKELKYYEITLKPKQEAYSVLMGKLDDALFSAARKDTTACLQSIRDARREFYFLEPYLPPADSLSDVLVDFANCCIDFRDSRYPGGSISRCFQLREQLRYSLYEALFREEKHGK